MKEESILLLGGRNSCGPSRNLLLLKDEKWLKLSVKLPENADDCGGVILHGEIYIFGGKLGSQLYKLENKTWKWIKLAEMNEERDGIPRSCLVWNDAIWVFGGYNGQKHLASVERYDPKEDKWKQMPQMFYPKSYSTAAAFNDKFYICGGNDSGDFLQIVECFDPTTGTWSILNDLPLSQHPNSLLSYGNGQIIMGSYSGKTEFFGEERKLEEEEKWTDLPPMREPRQSFGVAKLNDDIYIIGGYNGANTTDPYLKNVEIYNGASWRDGPPLPYGCWNMVTVVIPQEMADNL